jgi:hypothetical protein
MVSETTKNGAVSVPSPCNSRNFLPFASTSIGEQAANLIRFIGNEIAKSAGKPLHRLPTHLSASIGSPNPIFAGDIAKCEKAKFDEAKTHFDTNHCTTVPWSLDDKEEFKRQLIATLRRSLNLFPSKD